MEMNDFGFAPDEMEMDLSAPEEINQIPHSREAEEAVLGAVLINPEKYFDVSQLINSRDFYIHRNRWVWEAYGALFEKGQAIDVQTVCEELDAKGHLGQVGGKVFFYNPDFDSEHFFDDVIGVSKNINNKPRCIRFWANRKK